ncbi:MAG: energy-coupling factor ABC transporter permease [Gammaproteobacteria bacterium]
MDYTFQFLPVAYIWILSILAVLPLLLIATRVDWIKIRQRGVLNVWLICILLLAIVWMIRAGAGEDFHIHLLGAMLFALMFGWQLGVLGVAAVSLLICLWGNMLPQNLPLAIIFYALFAVSFSYLVFLLIEYLLPHNLYIYLYVSAFFGSALAYCLAGTLSALPLWLFDVHSWSTLINEYLPFVYLMSFAESFLTCGLLTVFVVYRPEWVFSFRDERYLQDK